MRCRDGSKTLAEAVIGIWQQKRYSDNFTVASNLYQGATSKRHNIIYDELLPRADISTRFCHHKKCLELFSQATVQEHDTSYPVHWHDWREMNWVGSIAISNFVNAGFLVLSHIDANFLDYVGDNDGSFNSRAWQAMKPELEGDVSLTNFLLELTDIKHIKRFFAPSSDLLKKISEGHLTWSFGIKPLINDLAEIYNSLYNYEKRIRDFLKRRNTDQRRYYSETVPETETSPHLNWNIRDFRGYSKTKVVRTATMTYQYDLEDIVSLLDQLQALRDILGLRLTPSVIWEAIPFSFVVDWFLNVGEFLKSRENAILEPTVFIIDYSISYKLQFDGEIDYYYTPKGNGPVKNMNVYILKGSIYKRRKCLPDTDGSPLSLSLLSSNQLALAASLFNVRR
jgi:hypothetical protein